MRNTFSFRYLSAFLDPSKRRSTNHHPPSPGASEKYLSSLPLSPSPLFCVRQRVFLGDDNRPKFGIFAIELDPLVHVRLCVRPDRICRTFWFTDTAIDALVRVYHQHVLAFVETVHRTDFHTVGVFAGNAGIVDNIGHARLPSVVRKLAKPLGKIIQEGLYGFVARRDRSFFVGRPLPSKRGTCSAIASRGFGGSRSS